METINNQTLDANKKTNAEENIETASKSKVRQFPVLPIYAKTENVTNDATIVARINYY